MKKGDMMSGEIPRIFEQLMEIINIDEEIAELYRRYYHYNGRAKSQVCSTCMNKIRLLSDVRGEIKQSLRANMKRLKKAIK